MYSFQIRGVKFTINGQGFESFSDNGVFLGSNFYEIFLQDLVNEDYEIESNAGKIDVSDFIKIDMYNTIGKIRGKQMLITPKTKPFLLTMLTMYFSNALAYNNVKIAGSSADQLNALQQLYYVQEKLYNFDVTNKNGVVITEDEYGLPAKLGVSMHYVAMQLAVHDQLTKIFRGTEVGNECYGIGKLLNIPNKKMTIFSVGEIKPIVCGRRGSQDQLITYQLNNYMNQLYKQTEKELATIISNIQNIK